MIVAVIFSLLLSAILYFSQISKAHSVITRTNQGVAFFIDGFFSEIINTIEALDENMEIRGAMALDTEAYQRILDRYRFISKANRNITYVYSGYENGLMLINDYTTPKKYDPATRPWYRAAMANKPETSIGMPYQDIQSKKWLVSTGKALKQSDGRYGGVVTIDCSVDQIAKLITQHDEYKTEFSFVMDRSGKIIMHPDQSVVGTSPEEMKDILQQAGNGDYSYRSANVEYFAHYSRIPSTGWTVITTIKKKEILHPIIAQVVLLIGLTSVIAVVMGFVQSTLLSRRLSRPLVELGKKIKAIIAGEKLDEGTYVYPDNEIGIMALEIGKLAAKELSEKDREIQASEEIYKTILMASPDDITITDLTGRIIMFSDAAPEMFGYTPEEGPGMSVMDFIAPEDRERAIANISRILQENYHGPNEYRAIRKDGSRFDIEVNNSLIRDQQGTPVRMVLIARDITNRKKAEQHIQELVHQLEIERDLAQRNSLTDSLTGLSNRRFFDAALLTEFSRHKRTGTSLSLIMMDVDHFKKYNDHYGHLEGDDCLRQIARTLKSVIERGTDIVARYGGEEFVAILPDSDLEGALFLAKRISEAVHELALAHATSETSEFVTISLGITSAADHLLTDAEQLVDLADQALFLAKKNGRNRYEVISASI